MKHPNVRYSMIRAWATQIHTLIHGLNAATPKAAERHAFKWKQNRWEVQAVQNQRPKQMQIQMIVPAADDPYRWVKFSRETAVAYSVDQCYLFEIQISHFLPRALGSILPFGSWKTMACWVPSVLCVQAATRRRNVMLLTWWKYLLQIRLLQVSRMSNESFLYMKIYPQSCWWYAIFEKE